MQFTDLFFSILTISEKQTKQLMEHNMGHSEGLKLQCWTVQAESKVKQDLLTALCGISQMPQIIIPLSLNM